MSQPRRLPHYDYRNPGAYFVTVCTARRIPIFGTLRGGAMHLTEFGRIARDAWDRIPMHFPQARLDESVVMPDHIHGIVIIDSGGARHASPPRQATEEAGARHASRLQAGTTPVLRGPPRLQVDPTRVLRGPPSGALGTIIGSYKSAVTREINRRRGTRGVAVWQRNFFEWVIRDEDWLRQVRWYIRTNPARAGQSR